MTSPVIMSQDSWTDDDETMTVSFVLPKWYTSSSSPNPQNTNVEIIDTSPRTIAVYSFRGRATERRAKKYLEYFKNELANQNISYSWRFLLAQYEPPAYFPLLRTNEWIVEIEPWESEWALADPDDMIDWPTAIATFAAGCFRCSEAAFQETEWVYEAIAWYAWGSKVNPTYEEVASGQTDHREAIRVIYDPTNVTYEDLLRIFRRQIDPTDAWGQFVDRGFQYTTAVFYHTEEEKELAEQSKMDLEMMWLYDNPIVTSILPFTSFYEAEPYHQDFYQNSKQRYDRYKKWSGRESYRDEIEERSELLEDDVSEDSLPPSWEGNELPSLEKREDFEKPSKDALRQDLTWMQFRVTQNDWTEPPYANAYYDNKKPWIYVDVVSGEPLFSSRDKYKSWTWRPSFVKPIADEVVTLHEDNSLRMTRTEVRSRFADSHLWHVFNDWPADRGGKRYCMNSASMRFIPLEEMEVEGYGEWMEFVE